MGFGFVEDIVGEVEDVAGDVVGGVVGIVDEDFGDSLDDLISERGFEMALVAAAAIYGGPALAGLFGGGGAAGAGAAGAGAGGLGLGSTASLVGGLGIASAGLQFLGAREQADVLEENARRRAAFAREKAQLDARQTREQAREAEGAALVEAGSTGAFTGARSFEAGTGVGSILATNRARALDLSKRLLRRGGREASIMEAEARDAARGARNQATLGLFSGILGAGTSALTTQASVEGIQRGRSGTTTKTN